MGDLTVKNNPAGNAIHPDSDRISACAESSDMLAQDEFEAREGDVGGKRRQALARPRMCFTPTNSSLESPTKRPSPKWLSRQRMRRSVDLRVPLAIAQATIRSEVHLS